MTAENMIYQQSGTTRVLCRGEGKRIGERQGGWRRCSRRQKLVLPHQSMNQVFHTIALFKRILIGCSIHYKRVAHSSSFIALTPLESTQMMSPVCFFVLFLAMVVLTCTALPIGRGGPPWPVPGGLPEGAENLPTAIEKPPKGEKAPTPVCKTPKGSDHNPEFSCKPPIALQPQPRVTPPKIPHPPRRKPPHKP